MDICVYDDVDSLEVLHLNLLCLDFPLTPERALIIRQQDPRPFPFFAVYARVDGMLAGQVGVFRLPVVSINGAEEVGGVWAVCTHPAMAHRGIASALLDEAHARMRDAGLRFSTLGTGRYRLAHSLYLKHGYEDVFSSPSACIARRVLPRPVNLRAERAGPERLSLADHLFKQIAGEYLGFARRHLPFFSFLDHRGYLSARDLWLIWRGHDLVGYVAAFNTKSVLTVANLLLYEEIDPVGAVSAVAHDLDFPYVQVRIDRPADIAYFAQAGFHVTHCDWGTFMVKPLALGATADDFRHRFGVGTDHFLISYMDVT